MPQSGAIRVIWGGLLCCASLGVAAHAGVKASANSLARSSPAQSLKLDAGQGRALTAIIDAKLVSSRTTDALKPADLAQIRTALRISPLNASLLRQLGMERDFAGKPDQARVFMRMAEKVSRRDLLNQIWLIEDAVRNDRVDTALSHYDIALTTVPSSQALAFPVLTSALAEPEIRAGLATYVRARRPWADAFLTFAIQNGAPAEVAAVMHGANLLGDPVARPRFVDLLTRFGNLGDIAGARRFAKALPGIKPETLSSLGFSPQTTDPDFLPLTWRLTGDGDIEAGLDQNNQLQVSVAPGASGIAASRMMLVAPGRFEYTYTVSLASGAASAAWQWTCLKGTSSSVFGVQDVPANPGRSIHKSAIQVPTGCSGVRIDLKVRGTEGQDNSDILIEDFRPSLIGS